MSATWTDANTGEPVEVAGGKVRGFDSDGDGNTVVHTIDGDVVVKEPFLDVLKHAFLDIAGPCTPSNEMVLETRPHLTKDEYRSLEDYVWEQRYGRKRPAGVHLEDWTPEMTK